MAADFRFLQKAGRIDSIDRKASSGAMQLRLDVTGGKTALVLDASDPLFPGASWTVTDLSSGFVGIGFLWDTSHVKLGNAGVVTVNEFGTKWTAPPRFNDTGGTPHQTYVRLPSGYRYCTSDFALTAKSYVCASSVARYSDGMRVSAWIRGDTDGRPWEGEFGFNASVTGIGADATACQAKQAGCTDVPPPIVPVIDAQCVNIRPSGAPNVCSTTTYCKWGALICENRTSVGPFCAVNSTYPCGACPDWSF